MVTIDIERLRKPEYSSLFRATGYFDSIFNGALDDVDCFIAGGCFRAFFSPDEKIDDIDIFSTSRSEAAKVVRKLRYAHMFKPYFVNKNAIKGVITSKGRSIKVDIVKRFYPDQLACISDFDYSVSKFSYHMKSKTIVHSDNFFPDLAMKRLVIPDTDFGNPIGSLKRLQKYVQKGYTACNGTLVTIARRLSQVDMDDPDQNDIEFYPDGSYKILLFD